MGVLCLGLMSYISCRQGLTREGSYEEYDISGRHMARKCAGSYARIPPPTDDFDDSYPEFYINVSLTQCLGEQPHIVNPTWL